MIPFGPQLIGQTEKALNALLLTVLGDSGPSEPEWVALRLAAQFDGDGSLADFVRDRAQLADAEEVLARLELHGLVAYGALTEEGATFLARTGRRIEELTAPIWDSLSAVDVAAAERALNVVLDRARSTCWPRP